MFLYGKLSVLVGLISTHIIIGGKVKGGVYSGQSIVSFPDSLGLCTHLSFTYVNAYHSLLIWCRIL